MSSTAITIRLGTRGSLLARTQSRIVADGLEKRHPGVCVELVIVKTTGDAVTDKPLYDLGGKGLFVKELELALLAGEVDFAVHSFKDVPVTMPVVDESNLIIAATTVREDPRDVLATRDAAMSLIDLPGGAKVATGSLRRRCQVLQARPDVVVVPIRGNIDTRLRKLGDGSCDAVILALAGLKRVGLFDSINMRALDAEEMLPSPGQGALALQCRKDDGRTRELLAALNDPDCERCVGIEREIVRRLGGDCHSPIAALATIREPGIALRVAVGGRDGAPPVIRAEADGSPDDVVNACIEALERQGVARMLQADPQLP